MVTMPIEERRKKGFLIDPIYDKTWEITPGHVV